MSSAPVLVDDYDFIGRAKNWGDTSKQIIFLSKAGGLENSAIAKQVNRTVEHVIVILRRYDVLVKETEFLANNPPPLPQQATALNQYQASIKRLYSQKYTLQQIADYLAKVHSVQATQDDLKTFLETMK